MDYFIRPYEKEDIPFLWEMLYQSIHIPEGKETPGREILKNPDIEKYLKDWGKKTDHALVAADQEGDPIGAIWIRTFNKESAGYGFIDEKTPELGMAILPLYRGKGLGRQLLYKMFAASREFGFAALSLSVDPRNSHALRLYEKSGFVKIEEDEGGSWTMKKDLATGETIKGSVDEEEIE
ncbi:MAG TPA: GNAT family N-acetyltransferase [Bacillales bacterium]|nr:GNAT family N-acetyltransferase [Bacillales bacterium]